MAGQPRAMLRKLDSFSNRAAALVSDLRRRMPRLYRERDGSGDPVADAWAEAIGAALDSWLAVDRLSAKIAARHEIERRLLPDASPIEIDGEYDTLNGWCKTYGTPPAVAVSRVGGGMDWECAIIMRVEPGEADRAARLVGPVETKDTEQDADADDLDDADLEVSEDSAETANSGLKEQAE